MCCSNIGHKYDKWYTVYFKIVAQLSTASEIWDNFEISRVVFMPNITYKTCYYFFIIWFNTCTRTNTYQNFRTFQTSLKLSTTAVLYDISVWFLCLLLRSGIVTFARFTAWILNLQLLKNGSFCGGEHRKRKIIG